MEVTFSLVKQPENKLMKEKSSKQEQDSLDLFLYRKSELKFSNSWLAVRFWLNF